MKTKAVIWQTTTNASNAMNQLEARVDYKTVQCMRWIHLFAVFYLFQDEKYDHIEAEEIEKVEKAVAEKDQWLNTKWNAQNKLAEHQDPAVYTASILSEKKVRSQMSPSLGDDKFRLHPFLVSSIAHGFVDSGLNR